LTPRTRLDIAERIEPLDEDVSFPNFDHGTTVAARLHIVKRDHGALKVPNE
jgi:hypothetical protein